MKLKFTELKRPSKFHPIRIDWLVYFMTVLFLCSLLGFTYELNGLQKFRVEVERDRLRQDKVVMAQMIIAMQLGGEVDRLRGMRVTPTPETDCKECHR